MADDINFVDLLAISKITQGMTVEKFGGIINSSLFDAANVLGSLSIKKLITFTTLMTGQNPITVTDQGKQLIAEANAKSKEEFDSLDYSVLLQLQAGKRSITDLGSALNVRQRDLALRLYKLAQQQYISYDFRSGVVDIMLTEKGFTQAKAGMPAKPQPQPQPAPQPPAQPQTNPQPATAVPGAPIAVPRPQMPPQTANLQQQITQQMANPQQISPAPQPVPGTGAPDAAKVEASMKAAAGGGKKLIIIGVVAVIVIVAIAAYVMKLI
jgi:hypothetical protein